MKTYLNLKRLMVNSEHTFYSYRFDVQTFLYDDVLPPNFVSFVEGEEKGIGSESYKDRILRRIR